MLSKSFAALIAAFIGMAATIGFVPPASAGFIFDLSVSGPFTGSGSITFDTMRGDSTSDVSAFAFHTSTGPGSPQDYDLADLATADWFVRSDPPFFSLTLLGLSTELVPFGSDQSAIFVGNVAGIPPVACPTGFSGGVTVTIRCTSTDIFFEPGRFSASFVGITIPEPATWVLFAGGLAGLGWMSRRRKIA